MSFNPGDRVRVSSRHSNFSNQLGVVLAVPTAGVYTVRPDGYAATAGERFLGGELMTSTQPVPITY